MIKILSFFNFFLTNFLYIPFFNIIFKVFKCNSDSTHFYLGVTCYSSINHLIYLSVSLFLFIFFTSVLFLNTFYLNRLGSSETSIPARVNCNYEVYSSLLKFLFFFSVDLVITFSTSKILYTIIQIGMVVSVTVIIIYMKKKVYFYNEVFNKLNLSWWFFILWSTVISIIVSYISLTESTLIHFVGWVGIYLHFYHFNSSAEANLFSDLEAFNKKSLKEVVSYLDEILKFCEASPYYHFTKRTTAVTLANFFEEIMTSDPDLSQSYHKFVMDSQLKNQFKNKSDRVILAYVSIVYDFYLNSRKREGDLSEENVLLHYCHFLTSILMNSVYCSYLCTKVEVNSNKNKFQHFLICEYFKEATVFNLTGTDKVDKINRIEIGTLLAYEYYLNLFFNKISEEVIKQCDFFTIFKREMLIKSLKVDSRNFGESKSRNFISLGREIMQTKEEIANAYNNILLLYPTREIKSHYFNYLNLVTDDDDKNRSEEKNYSECMNSYLKDRGEIYKSLFSPYSSIIVVDGYIHIGKLLYSSPNFSKLFITEPSVVNTVHDLVPSAIEQFHYDVVMNGIKFSNLSSTFNKQRHLFLRGEKGLISVVKVFIRSIPDLKHGLNYIISIIKVNENENCCNLVLYDDFKINGISSFETFEFDANKLGFVHIGFYIPGIFYHLRFSSLTGFHFSTERMEYIGTLFSFFRVTNEFRSKVNEIIGKLTAKIKRNGALEAEDEDLNILIQTVDLISENKSTIYYKTTTRNFVNNTYKYHHMQINKSSFSDKDSEAASLVMTAKNKKTTHQYKYALSRLNSDFFNNIQNNSSHIASVFSGGSMTSSSSVVQMSQKERLFNINNTKAKLERKKGELYYLLNMKRLSFIFILVSIVLSFISQTLTDQRFESMNTFISDNLFFRKSKIYLSLIYAAVNNLNSTVISNSDIQTNTNNLVTFVKDFHDDASVAIKFEQDLRKMNLNSSYFNLSTGNSEMEMSNENYIDLVLTMCLRLIDQDTNAMNTSLHYSMYMNDLIHLSENYILDGTIMGYDDTYLGLKYSYTNYFVLNNVILSINIGLIGIIIIFFIYYSHSLYKWEKILLHFTHSFRAPSFLKYLTAIIELKKKYTHFDEIPDEAEAERVEKEKEEKEKRKKEKKEVTKKEKKNKRKQEVTKKKDIDFENIRSLYWTNLYISLIKIMSILILSLFYYILTIILINRNINQTLSFKEEVDHADGLFYRNFNNYFNLKYFQVTKNFPSNFTEFSRESLSHHLYDFKAYTINQTNYAALDTLFNGNACTLFQIPDCSSLLNAVFTRGLDQSLISINLQLGTINPNSTNLDLNFISQYERFITVYLYNSYKFFKGTVIIMREEFIVQIHNSNLILLFTFLGMWLFSFFLLIYIINRQRDLFYSLLLFFFIVPSKHILEDAELTNNFIRLKKKL